MMIKKANTWLKWPTITRHIQDHISMHTDHNFCAARYVFLWKLGPPLKQYLRTGYNETRLEVRMYESKLHSRAKLHYHLVFCLRCQYKGLTKDEQQKINGDEGENLPKVWTSTLRLVCLAPQWVRTSQNTRQRAWWRHLMDSLASI